MPLLFDSVVAGSSYPAPHAMMLTLNEVLFDRLREAIIAQKGPSHRTPTIELQFTKDQLSSGRTESVSSLFIGGKQMQLSGNPEGVFDIYSQTNLEGTQLSRQPLQLRANVSASLRAPMVLSDKTVERTHTRTVQAEEQQNKRGIILLDGIKPAQAPAKKRKVTAPSSSGGHTLAKQAMRRSLPAVAASNTLSDKPLIRPPAQRVSSPASENSSSSRPLHRASMGVASLPPKPGTPPARSVAPTSSEAPRGEGWMKSEFRGGIKAKAPPLAKQVATGKSGKSAKVKMAATIPEDADNSPPSSRSELHPSSASSRTPLAVAPAAPTAKKSANATASTSNVAKATTRKRPRDSDALDSDFELRAASKVRATKKGTTAVPQIRVDDELAAAASSVRPRGKVAVAVDYELDAAAASVRLPKVPKKKAKVEEDELVAAASAIPPVRPKAKTTTVAPVATKKRAGISSTEPGATSVSASSPPSRSPLAVSNAKTKLAGIPKVSTVIYGSTTKTEPAKTTPALTGKRSSGTKAAKRPSPVYTSSEEEEDSLATIKARAKTKPSPAKPHPPPKHDPTPPSPASLAGSSKVHSSPHISQKNFASSLLSKPLPRGHDALREHYTACYVKYTALWARITAEKYRNERLLRGGNGSDDDGGSSSGSGEDVVRLTSSYSALHERLQLIRQKLNA